MSASTDRTNEFHAIVTQLDSAYETARNLSNLLDDANAAVQSLHGALDLKYEEVKAAFTGTPPLPVPEPATDAVPQQAFPESVIPPPDQLAHY